MSIFKRFFDLVTFGLFNINTHVFEDAFSLEPDECEHDWFIEGYVPVIGSFRITAWERNHPLRQDRVSLYTEEHDPHPHKSRIIHPLAGCVAKCARCQETHIDPEMSEEELRAVTWLEKPLRVSTKEYDAYPETHSTYRSKV